MQRLVKFGVVILLLVGIFSDCNENVTDNSPVSNNQSSLLKSSGPSAYGQGRIVGLDRVFSFNAVTHPDGSVSGKGQLTYTHNGNDVKFSFNIDCISVNGNVATMSGTVTNSNTIESGGPCWFKVVDNGEGRNASPDEMTLFIFCEPDDLSPECAELTCDNDIPIGIYPIEKGNIRVIQ